jgi:predicted dehydrogenase
VLPGLTERSLAAEGAGGRTLRVGLIGCGGRGTGAAIQTAIADPAVRVVALADLFDDQVASSAGLLAQAVGDRFEASRERRYVGPGAALDLVGSGVDVVILAGPPSTRPAHLEAAVAAGLHVWCETPAAIDPAGLSQFAAGLEVAEAKGLVVASGLCSRFSLPTARTIERVLDGAVGTIRSIALHHDGGLPWWKPLPPAATAQEQLERNWISHASRSGGHFLEHHVHALDRGLWLLGNDEPVAVEQVGRLEAPAAGHGGDVPSAVRVRYHFASGVVLDASCRRSATPLGSVESVVGSRGRADLLAGTVEEGGRALWQADRCRPGEAGGMYQAGIDAFLRTIRSGVAEENPTGTGTTLSGRRLLRATGLALMGRMTAEGRSVAWKGLVSPSARA